MFEWLSEWFEKIREQLFGPRIEPTDGFFYIFMLGMPEVGKSTLLASLCHYFQNSDKYVLRKDIEKKNNKGLRILLDDWLDMLDQNQFPPSTRPGELVEIPIGIQKVKEKEILAVSLLEISGEDLRDAFDPFNKKRKKIVKGIVHILEQSDLLILIVPYIDPDNLQNGKNKDDRFFELFLEKYESNIEDINIPVLLVLSKIDLFKANKKPLSTSSTSGVRGRMVVVERQENREHLEKTNKALYDQLISKRLPNTTAFVESFTKAEILPFSVGEVDMQSVPPTFHCAEKDKELYQKYIEDIALWIISQVQEKQKED